jgi:hypothetical protein
MTQQQLNREYADYLNMCAKTGDRSLPFDEWMQIYGNIQLKKELEEIKDLLRRLT